MNSDSSVISLRINSYEDIFSDFDIRPHAARSLSVDFLDEIGRATLDKTNTGIVLILHVHRSGHNSALESVIRDRLIAHFRKHVSLLHRERNSMISTGILMVFIGAVCMTVVTTLVFLSEHKSFPIMLAFAFLDPAGWFLLWEGMDQILFRSKENKAKLDFYRKMSHSKSDIHFKVFE